MVELAEIVGQHGEAYQQRFAERLLPSHRRALADITACRTPVLGGRLFACDDCGHQHFAYHSCNNRSCPKCSGARSTRWLAKREAELLPTRYFHVVFTLPEPWREVVRSHQKQLLPLLMRAAAQSLLALGADPRYLGGELGLLCVLHTWTRTLIYHPHVHCLVPAGALAGDGSWRPARKSFLLPVRALSRLFRGKFLHGARQLLPCDQRPAYSEQEWAGAGGRSRAGAGGRSRVVDLGRSSAGAGGRSRVVDLGNICYLPSHAKSRPHRHPRSCPACHCPGH
jgi:hypothetical protein